MFDLMKFWVIFKVEDKAQFPKEKVIEEKSSFEMLSFVFNLK